MEAAVALWRRLAGGEDGDRAAEARAGFALAALARGEVAGGTAALDRLELDLRAEDRPEPRLRVLLVLAGLALADGRLGEAVERAEEAERIAWARSRPRDAAQALGIAASAHLARGEEAAARRLAREAASTLRTLQRPDPRAALPTARCLADLGEVDEATRLLPERAGGGLGPLLDALRSRLRVALDPAGAARLARGVLAAAGPALPWRRLRAELDAAWALEGAADPAFSEVARAVEARSARLPFRLLRLEALLAADRAGLPGHRARAVERSALRQALLSELGEAARAWWT